MSPPQVLVSNAKRSARPDLLLDFQAGLLGIRVLHIRIHGREAVQHAGGHAGQYVRKCGSAQLPEGQRQALLLC